MIKGKLQVLNVLSSSYQRHAVQTPRCNISTGMITWLALYKTNAEFASFSLEFQRKEFAFETKATSINIQRNFLLTTCSAVAEMRRQTGISKAFVERCMRLCRTEQVDLLRNLQISCLKARAFGT